MLKYLEQKKADLEAKREVKQESYTDIEERVEEYRKILYAERNSEITAKNMLIDAQVAILDEVIEETKNAFELVEEEEPSEVELD